MEREIYIYFDQMERNKYIECKKNTQHAKSQQQNQTSSECIHLYANKCETTECSGTTQREGKYKTHITNYKKKQYNMCTRKKKK